jgi:hypothetical protein
MASGAARMVPERSGVPEPVKTAAPVSPPEGEIATVAYQLWLERGGPVGSDQEDWFRAEAILKDALLAEREDPSRGPAIPRGDIRAESEMRVDFRWDGHWEVWESEWGGARWVWDFGHVEVSNRAA